MHLTRIVFAFLVLLPVSLFASDYKLERTESTPPEEVSPAMRDVAGAGALKVSDGDQVVAEFWFRDEVPTKDTPSGELGVNFGNLAQGTFFGILRLSRDWRDYKNLAVKSGVYTLRYGVQPADGNHMGVAPYRDYLLLIPATQDKEVEVTWSPDELYLQSYGSTGQPHPGILALFPVYDEVTEPKIVKNELDQWTVALSIGSLKLGLVIEGHGEIH